MPFTTKMHPSLFLRWYRELFSYAIACSAAFTERFAILRTVQEILHPGPPLFSLVRSHPTIPFDNMCQITSCSVDRTVYPSGGCAFPSAYHRHQFQQPAHSTQISAPLLFFCATTLCPGCDAQHLRRHETNAPKEVGLLALLGRNYVGVS